MTRYCIDYIYTVEETEHSGRYITDDPRKFTQFMRQQYGDNVTFHIQEVN